MEVRAYNEMYLDDAMTAMGTMLDYAANYQQQNIDDFFQNFECFFVADTCFFLIKMIPCITSRFYVKCRISTAWICSVLRVYCAIQIHSKE